MDKYAEGTSTSTDKTNYIQLSPAALTIAEFCTKWKISNSTYHLHRRQGRMPRTIQIGRSRRITPEAEAAWLRQREAEAGAQGAEAA